MSLMSSASSSKPSSFCVQKKRRNGSMLRGRGRAPERAPSSQGSPLPPSPPARALPTPSHCRAMPRARGELWAAAGLRVASAPRAAATVAPRGSRGPFFPPRRHLPLRHLAAHERCELLLRLRARLLQGGQGADAQRHLRRARLDACSRVRTRQQAARASARVPAALSLQHDAN